MSHPDTPEREQVEDIIEKKLQEAFSEILEVHDLETGDITPLQQAAIDQSRDELVEDVMCWIQTRLEE